MKLILIKFILFFYNIISRTDLDILVKIGKIIMYPFYIIRCIYNVILTPLYFVYFLWTETKLYRELSEIINEIKFSMGMIDMKQIKE